MMRYQILRRLTSSVSAQFRTITTTPRARAEHKDTVGIIGLPFNKGQPKGGVEGGPAIIREQGLTSQIEDLGYRVKDHGDMEFTTVANDTIGGRVKNPRTIGKAMHEISDRIQGVVQGDGVCVTLGGDHSIALGTIHGHCQVNPNACVIWIDAHADLNTPITTPTGNFHGMPISFLLKELETDCQHLTDAFPEWSWIKPCLTAKDIVYIGLRDVDAGERMLLKKLGIRYFCMYEIDKWGMAYCIQEALKAVNPNMDRPIHLSYDIDSLDPYVVPSTETSVVGGLSTGTPVDGGLTLREGFFIAEEIASTNLLSVMDMVEVNPALGDTAGSALTASYASRIITSCLGCRLV